MKKLNVVDYAIFLVILVTVFLLSKTVFVKNSDVWVEVVDDKNVMTGIIDPVWPWETENIIIGTTIFNDVGGELANVAEVNRAPWKDGSKMRITLVVKMHLMFDKRQKIYLLNNNPLRIGDKIYLNFGKNGFNGRVKNIYLTQDDFERSMVSKNIKATIKVKLKNYEMAVLEKIKLMKEILKVEITQGNSFGKYDAVLTIELSEITCSLNVCYDQNYQPLVIGNNYWMNNGMVGFENETTIIDQKIEHGN